MGSRLRSHSLKAFEAQREAPLKQPGLLNWAFIEAWAWGHSPVQFSSLASKEGGARGWWKASRWQPRGGEDGGAKKERVSPTETYTPSIFLYFEHSPKRCRSGGTEYFTSISSYWIYSLSFSLSVNFKLKSLSVVVPTCSNLGSNTKSHTMNYRTLIIEKKNFKNLVPEFFL